MSFWDKILESISGDKKNDAARDLSLDTSKYAFVDTEVGLTDHKVHDLGSLRYDGAILHSANHQELFDFLQDVDYVCGHNIIHHDAKYLFDKSHRWAFVDTLYFSPLLFPEKPYHRLLKDDKLMSSQMNNPVNDCEKARDLLMDEVARWELLSVNKRIIYSTLLRGKKEFNGFLNFVHAPEAQKDIVIDLIRSEFLGLICEHADIKTAVSQYPCELAYALALIETTDHRSITPAWVLHNYPNVEHVIKLLRRTKCTDGCKYCNQYIRCRQGQQQSGSAEYAYGQVSSGAGAGTHGKHQ